MRRGRLIAPVLLALSGLGWAAAHGVAHRAVTPAEAMSGVPGLHGYLAYLPVSLAIGLALALPLAAGVVSGLRWRRRAGAALWLFGVVPVLGYAGHALVEPLVVGSAGFSQASSTAAHLTPAALVGLLVQIPFALVAVALGRRVLQLAEHVAGWLVGPRRAVGGRVARAVAPAPRTTAPVLRLEPSRSERGPPLPLLA